MEEEEAVKKPVIVAKPDLEIFSIEALNDYIVELNTEIERAKSAITGKNSARNAADAVFKS
jgi:uncharacterized small protein (DUF1192 family)